MTEKPIKETDRLYAEFDGGSLIKFQMTPQMTPWQLLGLAGQLEAIAKSMIISSVQQVQGEEQKIEVAKPKVLRTP